ncbi:MAG: hypothetical protein K2Q22_05050, partial [Cytophagales bacterium]|nr:hypothetical protein [Cytophagales bacterium]
MKRKLFYPMVIALLCVLGAHMAVLAQSCNVTLSTTSVVCPGGSNGTAAVLLNGRLLTVSGIDAGNNPISCLTPSSPSASDNCTSCNQTITSSGSVSVGVGQKVCITASNYSGDLQVSGGTLVICGNANVQNMNLNTNGQAFTLIVRGSLTIANINSDANMVLRNFGTVTFNNSVGF